MSNAQATVFQSWPWIDAWLSVMKPDVLVVECKRGEQLVGLCLLTQAQQQRFGWPIKRLYLQQTGVPAQDQIWVEYNQPLVHRVHAEAAMAALVHYISHEISPWHEWVLSGVKTDHRYYYQQQKGFFIRQQWSTACYGVDLQLLRQHRKRYLDSLSANTRYQLKRCEKKLQQRGDTRLERPKDTSEALAWFQEIAPLHRARWEHTPEGSGFNNAQFLAFHQYLVANYWQPGFVDLIALMVGDKRLALFYNFQHQNVVYFYLAGIHFETDNQIKPGLLGHALMIQQYIDQGADYYDFMGGDAHYKMRLGQLHSSIEGIIVQRKSLAAYLEQGARNLKQRLLGNHG
ncbi:MAG: GNAT family N-acetyltransferase [Alkalimonas sp.]|nr:GNAT family N-acetyltransferase [Alkalimonas sp.]